MSRFSLLDESETNVAQIILQKGWEYLDQDLSQPFHIRQIQNEKEKLSKIIVEGLILRQFRQENLQLGNALRTIICNFYPSIGNRSRLMKQFIEIFDYFEKYERSILNRNSRHSNSNLEKLSENHQAIPTSADQTTLKFLKFLGKTQNFESSDAIVDAGCLFGAAACAFAEGHSERKDFCPVTIFCVDNFQVNQWHIEQFQQSLKKETLNLNESYIGITQEIAMKYKRACIQVIEHQFNNKQCSEEQQFWNNTLEGKQIQLLFFDLNFDQDSTENFFKNCESYLKHKAIIVFNQYGNTGSQGIRNYLFQNRGSFQLMQKLESGPRVYYYIKREVIAEEQRNSSVLAYQTQYQFQNMTKNQKNKSVFRGIDSTGTVVYAKRLENLEFFDIGLALKQFQIVQDKKSREFFAIEEQVIEKLNSLEEVKSLSDEQVWNFVMQLTAFHNQHTMENKNFINNLQIQQNKLQRPPQLQDFLDQVQVLIEEAIPNVFKDEQLVMVHGKLTPNKVLFENSTVRMFDFEHVHFNFASFDFVFIENLKESNVTRKLVEKYCQIQNRDVDKFTDQVKIQSIIEISKNLMKTQYKKLSVTERQSILNKSSRIILSAQGCNSFDQPMLCNAVFIAYEKLIEWCYSHITNKYDKKFNLRDYDPFPNNQGWRNCCELIKTHLHSDKSKTFFISAIEDYLREYKTINFNCQQIVGVIHKVPRDFEISSFSQNQEEMAKMKSFYTLTSALTRHVEKYVNSEQPVHTLTYCATPPQRQFNIKQYFSSSERYVAQIGEYHRDTFFFLNLSVPKNFQKVIKSPCKQDFTLIEQFVPSDPSQAVIFNKERLSDSEYEEFLLSSVVLMKLFDAGGCTVVVDCVARNIPIIINYLDPLAEYLGKYYPLFYSDASEIENLLTEEKLTEGYEYQLKMDKSKFFGENFLDQISSSGFYRTLPLPLGASKYEEFKTLPLTILINSYKRLSNIPNILSRLAHQSDFDSKQVQVIIWNNNEQEHGQLTIWKHDLQDQFYRIEIITSSQNYYCISRSAVSHLGLGKLLLVIDDDIMPAETFVKHMLSSYKRLKKEKKTPKMILTLRGNIFQDVENDIREQFVLPDDQQFGFFLEKFENKMTFLNEDQEEQEIHLIHADVMLIPMNLMKQVSSYQMPQRDFVLVDDYWYSFIAAFKLKALLIKIQGSNQIEVFSDAEDPIISLHLNAKVTDSKISLYQYHMQLGWPFRVTVGKQSMMPQKKRINNHSEKIEFIQIKEVYGHHSKFDVWEKGFFGANTQLKLGNSGLEAALNYGIDVFRIGTVNEAQDIPKFLEKDSRGVYKFIITRDKLDQLENRMQKLLKHNVKVIFTIHCIPLLGEDPETNQISFWASEERKTEFALFWRDLALVLSRYLNVIGYDLINEPSPQSTKDLISFYDSAIKLIREVDKRTPIIIGIKDGEQLTDITLLKKYISDPSIIFTIHFYQPQRFTMNKQTYKHLCYPGPIPEESNPDVNYMKNCEEWNIHLMRKKFQPLVDFMIEYKLKPWRIFIGEYGVRRDANGSVQYLSDLVSVIKELDFNSCFYSFREDFWDGMDFEMKTSLHDRVRVNQYSPFAPILFTQQPKPTEIVQGELFSHTIKKDLEDRANDLEPWDLRYNPSSFSLRGKESYGDVRQILFSRCIKRFDWQPLFVVGCSRSGTTLALQIISQCENIFALNEPRELWFNALPEFDIWSQKAEQRHGKLFFDENSSNEITEGQILHVKEMFEAFIYQATESGLISSKQGKLPIFAEKTPENIFRLHLLRKIFPLCKIIVVQREKAKIVNSTLKFAHQDWFGHQGYKLRQLQSFMSEFGGSKGEIKNEEIEYEASQLALRNFESSSAHRGDLLQIYYEDLLDVQRREDVLINIEEYLILDQGIISRDWCNTNIKQRH